MDSFQVQSIFNGTIMENGYGFVSQWIMRHSEIPYQSKAIYCYLASFSGVKMECYPSVSLIEKELGMPEETYYKYLKVLKIMGLVKTERVKREGNKFKGTLYTLIIRDFEIKEQALIYEEEERLKKEKVHTPEKMGMENHTTQIQGKEIHGMESRELKVPDLKVSELKVTTTTATDPEIGQVISSYEQEFGRPLTKMECEKVQDYYDDLGKDLTIEVLREAVEARIINFKYMNGIVTDWQKKGIRSMIDLEHERKQFELRKNEKEKIRVGANNKKQDKPKESKYNNFYL